MYTLFVSPLDPPKGEVIYALFLFFKKSYNTISPFGGLRGLYYPFLTGGAITDPHLLQVLF